MSTTKISADLAAIIDMADRLESRAIDLAGGDIPGGDAMVNLAHVADMSTWLRRNDLAGDALEVYEDPDEFWSSFQTLRFWSEQWRTDLGMDHDDPTWRPSLRSEAAFLRNVDVLAWAWDTEPHWDDFAGDVRLARRKLEDVLQEGARVARIRVTCPDCAQADEDGAQSDEQGLDGESHQWDSDRPADRHTAPRLFIVYGETREEDRWKCPECKHRFDADHVRRASTQQMRKAGVAQRWISYPDALAILRKQGWRETTIRTWAHNPSEVSSTTVNGVPRYWWPDLWRCHLLHRWEVNENRKRAEERAQRKAECGKIHGADCWIFGRGCAVSLAERAVV